MAYEPNSTVEAENYKFLFSQASNGTGQPIGGATAVQFFVRSGLPTPTLKSIWSTSVSGRPDMSSKEFYTAMRLISLAQSGRNADASTLSETSSLSLPPPKFQGIEYPRPGPPAKSASTVSTGGVYSLTSEVRANYEKLWTTLPKNDAGLLEGKEAAQFLAKSGQAQDVLKQIWRLSDISQDGLLDLTEFLIAMHLTMMAKKGNGVPSSLPDELLSSARGGGGVPPPVRPPAGSAPAMLTAVPTAGSSDDAMMSSATAKMNESANLMRQASSKMQTELGSLKGEKDRLVTALSQANSLFVTESDKLNRLTEEVNRMREEIASLRLQVDSKRSAVSTTQDLISNKLNEKSELVKQMPPGMDLGVGQKRRAAPSAPPSEYEPSSNPPQPSSNAFDAFEDPYGMQ